MDYMQWAKLHRRVRWELTESGIPHATWEDLPEVSSPPALTVEGPYGNPDLIEAIALRYCVAPECVVPVPGASSANVIALAVALNRGDSILVERPAYQPLDLLCGFLGLTIVPLTRRATDTFRVLIDDVHAGLSRGARAVLITNLHNPTGQLIPLQDAARIADLCAEHAATLIVDEVYLDAVHLAQGGALWTAAGTGDHVITTNSLSKLYGFADLRIGWLLAGKQAADRARSVMDLLSVNSAAPSMCLAARAFSRMDKLEDRYRAIYSRAYPVFTDWLKQEPRVTRYPHFGALFACVGLPRGVSSTGFNDLLVSRYETQVVPGAFFGMDDHVRISLSPPPEVLAKGLSRMSLALNDLMHAG